MVPMTWHHHRRQRRHRSRAWTHSHLHGFGPWGRQGRFFGPGEVRLALLSLLSESPQHGYQLMRGLEDRSGGVYKASPGTIYPTLQQLEDEGLVSSERQGGKRVYSITDHGRQLAQREARRIEEIWRRADEWGSWDGLHDPAAAELMRPAMLLIRSALRAVGRSEDPLRVDDIRDILERARRELDDLEGRPS